MLLLAVNGSHYYHSCWRHAAAYVLSPPLRLTSALIEAWKCNFPSFYDIMTGRLNNLSVRRRWWVGRLDSKQVGRKECSYVQV